MMAAVLLLSLFIMISQILQQNYADVVIFEVNPSQGSLFGGTRLVIRGSGFSSNTNSQSNLVFIGSRFRCDPIPLHSTVNQIICKTQPATDGYYPTFDVLRTGPQNITVVVDGAETSVCRPVSAGKACNFEYRTDWFYTPRIESLSPLAISAGAMLTVSGRFHSAPFSADQTQAPRLEVPLASVKVANREAAQQQPSNEPFGTSGTRCSLFDAVTDEPYPLVQNGAQVLYAARHLQYQKLQDRRKWPLSEYALMLTPSILTHSQVSQFTCLVGGPREAGRYNLSVALLGQVAPTHSPPCRLRRRAGTASAGPHQRQFCTGPHQRRSGTMFARARVRTVMVAPHIPTPRARFNRDALE
jgi:hypothetical protein